MFCDKWLLKGNISVFDIIYFRKAEKKLINMVAITPPLMSQCEELLTLLQNIIDSFVSNLGLLQLLKKTQLSLNLTPPYIIATPCIKNSV